MKGVSSEEAQWIDEIGQNVDATDEQESGTRCGYRDLFRQRCKKHWNRTKGFASAGNLYVRSRASNG